MSTAIAPTGTAIPKPAIAPSTNARSMTSILPHGDSRGLVEPGRSGLSLSGAVFRLAPDRR